MHDKKRYWWAAVLMVLVTLMLAGCASRRPVIPSDGTLPKVEGEKSGKGWWYARFRMNWPQDNEPAWYLDLFLADMVVSPVLSRHGGDIMLWRFHRRAARDGAGHQFSFIFYSSPEAARRIFESLRADSHLKAVKTAGMIIQDNYDNTATIAKPNVEDTSDSKWSTPIKKSWPYFIMGVSDMWLNLIQEIVDETSGGKRPSSPDEIRKFYQRVNDSIGKMWREEGRHAFLHHMNALFGYEPLVVYEKRLMDF